MELKLGTKDVQVPFFTAFLLPLNNLRDLWNKKRSVKKENLIHFEINIANFKLDMEQF